jgi:hypothetical protein
LLQFVPGELAQRVGDGLLSYVTAVQVDQGGALAVVAHAVHQLAERRPSGGGQGVSGVPQVMKVQAGDSGRLERGEPAAAPEVAVM